MDYYVKRGDAEKGPYSLAGLTQSLEDGSLDGATLVRAEKSEEWVRLSAVLDALRAPEPRARPASSAPATEAELRKSAAAERARRARKRNEIMAWSVLMVAATVLFVFSYSSPADSHPGYVAVFGGLVIGAARLFRRLRSR